MVMYTMNVQTVEEWSICNAENIVCPNRRKEVLMNEVVEKEVVVQRLLNRRKEVQAEISELMSEEVEIIVELSKLGKTVDGYEIPF